MRIAFHQKTLTVKLHRKIELAVFLRQRPNGFTAYADNVQQHLNDEASEQQPGSVVLCTTRHEESTGSGFSLIRSTAFEIY